MKRLLTLCLILVFAFSLIAFMSMSIGHEQPASKALKYWHLDDCAPPCWAGITHSSPATSEAIDRVSRLFTDYKMTQFADNTWKWTKADALTGGESTIYLGLDGQFVEGISLDTNLKGEAMPTLGELMAILGSPTCVSNSASARYLTLHYTNSAGQVMLHVGVYQLSVTGAVEFIAIRSEPNADCQFLVTVPWHGFQDAERYIIAP